MLSSTDSIMLWKYIFLLCTLQNIFHLTEGIRRSKFLEGSLDRILQCTIEKSLSDLEDYGCWCGSKEGNGNPVDAIDICCRHHKVFLQLLLKSASCNMFTMFALPYDVTCSKNNQQPHAICTENMASVCAKKLCKGDIWLANCIRKQISDVGYFNKPGCSNYRQTSW
ncbi:Acidic phospholipase -like protein [Trichinella patagoniensis]|uniref:Acidic phospholipase-like protein n=1 Tax=Trichinella patagoniensis TaxID=990121 RepID=A0A0V1AE47_9BILA|nr:Acidic phospholipase -like protein [Trichinella patagoniensis]